MSYTKELLRVEYHYDDDSDMYYIGEVDFGITSGILSDYLKRYGEKGMKDIVAILGHLIYEVKKRYFDIQEKNRNNEDCQQIKGE